jgi:hypothetical protein
VTVSDARSSRRTFLAVAGLSLAAAGCSAAGQSSATAGSVAGPTVETADVSSTLNDAGAQGATPPPADGGIAKTNVFAPVVATAVTVVAPPVPGSDGLIHVQYELQIVNGSSGPHLHFHVMNGPSVLGSEGLPYVFTTFQTAGMIDKARFDATMDFVGDWSAGRAAPVTHTDKFPMDKQILNFA